MSFVDRLNAVAGLFLTHSIGIVIWLYFQPLAADIVEQFPGPFSSSWDLLTWVVPTYFLLALLLFGGWLVIGGVQQEQARDRRRVRR